MKTSIRSVVVVCCAMLCTSGVAEAQSDVPQAPDIQCAPSASIFRVTSNGDMLLYNHLEPETGVLSWTPNPPVVGRGWQTLRPVAAPDGVIYAPHSSGALRRYRWNGSTWDRFPGGAQHEVIEPTGWEQYVTTEYRNRITTDTDGGVYTVGTDGWLHWRFYDPGNKTWSHQNVASGWDRFDLIVAGGKGVLYARESGGDLYRFEYHPSSQRWLGEPQLLGPGWQAYDRILSAGADTLYAIKPNGEMFWFRWNPDEEDWVLPEGQRIGAAWFDRATTAVPGACVVPHNNAPTRPTVLGDPSASPSLLYTGQGSVHYSYVDREGRIVKATVDEVSGDEGLAFSAVRGAGPVVGPTSVAEDSDGAIHLVGTGRDAEVRSTRQAMPGGSWSQPVSLGGFLSRPAFVVDPGSAVLPDRNGGGLMAFGLDADGELWTRSQPSAGGPFEPWTNIGTTPIVDDTLTVVPAPGRVRLLGLSGDGAYYTADYDGDGLGVWSTLGGDQFEGAPSAVLMPDDTLQVFGVRDGDMEYKREITSGFDGPWESLLLADALTESAVGSSSAIMAPNGGLVVGVRTDQDHVVYSGQVTPGSTQWTDWEEITDYTVTTESNPRLLAVPDENTWVVAYRNSNNTPLLFRHVMTATFTQIPLVLPRR